MSRPQILESKLADSKLVIIEVNFGSPVVCFENRKERGSVEIRGRRRSAGFLGCRVEGPSGRLLRRRLRLAAQAEHEARKDLLEKKDSLEACENDTGSDYVWWATERTKRECHELGNNALPSVNGRICSGAIATVATYKAERGQKERLIDYWAGLRCAVMGREQRKDYKRKGEGGAGCAKYAMMYCAGKE